MSYISHVAFSDESHHNIGRFRGVSMISLKSEHRELINNKLQSLLNSEGVTEFKWTRTRGIKERNVGIQFLNESVSYALKGMLRIDVLVWDIEDSRHKIRDRDDVANLQRMYYHIFKNVLSKRWPDKSSWILYPDQNTAIDWDTIEDILDIKSSNIEAYSNLFTKGRFKFRLKEEFNIREIVPCGSEYEPLIQLGDLYAGMAIYSRDSYNMYRHLAQTLFTTVKQLSLFDVEIDNSIKPSRADKERCRLIFEFNKLCKSKKLGVSLDTYRGLRTRDPSNPINFWWYEPQHELDKAPLKQKY
jgi:hypothetical protein